MKVVGEKPANIEIMEGDFLELDLSQRRFDAIVCADVFEHVVQEQEEAFAGRCVELLEPGGVLVVSTPHKGQYAWLDPYEVKPAIHRLASRVGMHNRVHNGFCDIRKGHKHYTAEELIDRFRGLEAIEIRRWGRLFDPLSSWSNSLGSKLGFAPWRDWIDRRLIDEYSRDPGEQAFNIAIKFRKAVP